MINVKFFKADDILIGFEAEGHSMSAPKGEDLICAFVSSACLMAANTVTEIIGADADASAEDGYLILLIKKSANSAQDILNGLKLHLTELQKDYPENINVIISEV
ncbi:MAG: ribosomal-processing cysteine protease Prp [Eubacterium sp.]|nr:ribosomal-processing cysteine protease Prp [Eubacterium sp.]